MSNVKTANRDINALNKIAQEACRLFLAECERQGVKIFITEGIRSIQRQEYLYSLGRTRPGNIVTSTMKSLHIGGMAWDIAVSPPKALYDKSELARAGAVAGRLGIEWGGNWTRFVDNPHFQIDKNWKNPQKLNITNNKTKFNLNGKLVDIEGFLEGGKTYVTIRDLLENLGYEVGWDNNTKSVTVDKKPIDFDKRIIDGKTYAVARPLLEKLGFKVGWEASTKTVIVTK